MNKDLHSQKLDWNLVIAKLTSTSVAIIFTFYEEDGKLKVSGQYNLFGDRFTEIDNSKMPVEIRIEKGNVVWHKYSNGAEYFYEFDEKGRVTHQKNVEGKEHGFRYDERGNMIWHRYPNGDEYTYGHNELGYIIWQRNPNGKKISYE